MSEQSKNEQRQRFYRGAAREEEHRDNRRQKNQARKQGNLPQKQKRVRKRDWDADDDDDDQVVEREVIRSQRVKQHDRLGATTPPSDLETPANALVIGVDRDAAVIRHAEDTYRAKTNLPVAVGDAVAAHAEGDHWRITGLAPRRSVLARPDPAQPERERVLAANVDLAICVLSLKSPALKLGLVDRFLVACQRGKIATALVINKIDLCQSATERQELDRELERFGGLGLPTFLTSSATGEQIEALGELIRGRRSVFSGHSGVGKSSLLNALDPETARRIGRVREADGKGRHTTVRSSLVQFPDGTELIDTPGVRAFGLARISIEELRFYFSDLEAASANCRFTNCRHRTEPDCGVKRDLTLGLIHPARYQSYLRLLAEVNQS